MADFRKWILAFAALVLLVGSAVPAAAQGPQIQCSVTTVPNTLRHEGLTELIGDILLSCTPGTGYTGPLTSGTVPQANISVSLGATLSTNFVGTAGGLDSLLLVDDPAPNGNQTVCPSPTNGVLCADAADGGLSYNRPGVYNVFQGVPGGPGSNSITFLGVPIDPPATALPRTYRITNVRIQGPSVPASTFGLTPVYAFLSTGTSTSISISPGTAQPIVGFVTNGLAFTPNPNNLTSTVLQCQSVTTPTAVTAVKFQENFQTAFKIQGCGSSTVYCQLQPGALYPASESGLEVSANGGETGSAATATEFQTVITSVPTGAVIWVDAAANGTILSATGVPSSLISTSSASLVSPASTTTATASNGNIVTQVLDNTAGGANNVTIVWAVTAEDPLATDAFTFNIYVTNTAQPNTSTSPITPVPATALSGFSPQVGAWTQGNPYPEFSSGFNNPTGGQNLFGVTACETLLLFPYVTDVYGFDTGIAISNTSLDSLGSAGASSAVGQSGTCSVAFFGGTSPGVSANIGTTGNTPGYVNSTVSYNGIPTINGTGVIGPGQTWAFSMSSTDTDYNLTSTSGSSGYAIATCTFQYAHGYSFVSDTGIMKFAAAYLALIIPDATRSAQPFICSSLGTCGVTETGEQLVH